MLLSINIWVAAICTFSQVAAVTSAFPTVSIQNGTLRGFEQREFSTENFLGIPYAQPPIQTLRFRHPQAIRVPWTKVRNATDFGDACPGYGGFSANMTMSEDCLTLNVLRPSGIDSQDSLPVLVWIHGGGEYAGSHSFETSS